MSRTILCGLTALAGLGLAACSGTQEADLATKCLLENDVPGAYAFDARMAVPLVTPVDDGTQDGADILNACIQRMASGTSTGSQQSAAAETDYLFVELPPLRDPETPPAPARPMTPAPSPANAVCPPGAPLLYKGVYCAN